MYSENGKFPFKGCYNISIKLIYYPIFSSAIWICLKLNPLMATQIKDGLHFFSTSLPGSAYLSNAFTIISSLYILQSVKRPKYLFPPSIKICKVFLVKEIKLFYEFKIPATDFTMFLVLLYFFIFMIHPCRTFCYN